MALGDRALHVLERQKRADPDRVALLTSVGFGYEMQNDHATGRKILSQAYDLSRKVWTSAGVGNIAARFFGPVNFKNQMSYNGIVGHNVPNTMNDQDYPGEEYNQVMLCSDGIRTRIDLARYPMMYKYDLAILAAAIYKDHARRNDDMSVVIAKVK